MQTASHHGWIKMKLILVALVVGLLAWKLSPQLQSLTEVRLSPPTAASSVTIAPKLVSPPFKCDGRKYCSQMHLVQRGQKLSAKLPRHGDGR